MSTAARIALFSIVTLPAALSAAGHTLLGGTDDNARAATWPGRRHARRRGSQWPPRRTRSTRARSDNSVAGGGTRGAGSLAPPEPPLVSLGSPLAPLQCHGAKRLAHLVDQCRQARRERRPAADHDEIHAPRRDFARRAVGLAQPAARAIALHGAADLAADGEARTTRTRARTPQYDQRRSLDSLALLKERLERRAAGEPFGPAQPALYTVSRFRPFARRRFKTFRPPAVFIRSRKP